jgi:hypothetical protein
MHALTWPTERATRDAIDEVPQVIVGYSSEPSVPSFMRFNVDLVLSGSIQQPSQETST